MKLETLISRINAEDAFDELGDVLDRSLVQQMCSLLTELEQNAWTGPKKMSLPALNPLSMYLSFLAQSPTTTAFEQSDASEFLHILIDRLNTELLQASMGSDKSFSFNRGPESEMSRIFRGFQLGSIQCTQCSAVSEQIEVPFLELHLHAPECRLFAEYFVHRDTGEGSWKMTPPDILDCLDHGFRSQPVVDSQCSSCGSQSIKRTCTLLHAPPVLVLNLHPASSGVKQGECSNIILRESIDISPFCVDAGGVYSLVGVVVHQGKLATSGHYSCYSKRSDGWRFYNDAHGKSISTTQEVLETIGKQIKSAQPSLAVFERVAVGVTNGTPLYQPLAPREVQPSPS